MRLLVTGGAGFIGSHFIRSWFSRHPDDEIVNLDLLTYAGSRARLAEIEGEGRYTFIEGDICSSRIVKQAMAGCDTVVHFAAESHVDRSITDAAPFIRTNIEGTQVLLQEAQVQRVERFIHTSSDEVYGPVLDGAVDERAPLSPRSPYAASKAAGDLLAQAFHHTYRLPVIVVRPTNIYGPGQLPEKLIPLCITNGMDRLPIPVYGDGQQRRAWLFAMDLCRALEVIIEQGAFGEIYNVAGGSEQTNLETVKGILASLGCPANLIEFVTDRPGHDRRYAMNDTKLRSLGWRAQVPFNQGLQETIAWYRGRTDWWRPIVQKLREDPYHWLNRTARSSPPQTSGAVL